MKSNQIAKYRYIKDLILVCLFSLMDATNGYDFKPRPPHNITAHGIIFYANCKKIGGTGESERHLGELRLRHV